MHEATFWERVAVGAAAGFLGTLALQFLRAAEQKLLPMAQAPMTEHPGRFMVRKAETMLPLPTAQRIPVEAESVVGQALGFAYGATLGAVFAGLRSKTRLTVWDGVALGLATWAAGFLGWLPVSGLMPPVWKQKPRQIAAPIAEHAVFGLATVAGFQWLKGRAAWSLKNKHAGARPLRAAAARVVGELAA